MRAILINPCNQTVSEVDTNGNIDGATGFYELLGAADPNFSNTVELIRVGPDIDLWIDEEGCLNDGRPVFRFLEGPFFAGAALLLAHTEGGDSAPLPAYVTLEKVQATILWTDLLTTGDFTPGHSEPIDHPVFGKTMAVHTGDAIYRKARGYFVYQEVGGKPTLATAQHFINRADALVFAATVQAVHPDGKVEIREMH